MTTPSGNGEARGPESAPGNPGKLPGTRPERAAANNRRNADFLGQTPVADQGGFGKEDMHRDAPHINLESVRPADIFPMSVAPDLMQMGDASETFGGE